MRIEVLGTSFHYEVRGDGGAAESTHPVLFLHGFSQSLATWYPVVERMPDEHIVLLDLIGHGESDKPEVDAPYSVFSQVEQLEAVRQAFGLGPVRVVGYSMGGRIALMYAVRYPASISALVLESASFGPRTPAEREAYAARDRAMAERVRESSASEFARWWAETPVLASQQALPLELQEAEARSRAANDTQALARALLGSGQSQMPTLFEAASRLPMPLLYICGAHDAKYSALADEAHKAWGLDVRRFATGHNVHLERPHEYAETLVEFFERVDEE